MMMRIHATYKAGVIHPDVPLNLPDNAELDLTLTAIKTAHSADKNGACARPPAPKISLAELRERVVRHAVSAQSLPEDFSRGDIYQDHD